MSARILRYAVLLACCGAVTLPAWALAVKGLKVLHTETGRYIALRDLSAFYGMKFQSHADGSIALVSPYSRLEFQQDSRRSRVNGATLWLNAPLSKISRRWCITETDVQVAIDPLLRSGRHLAEVGHSVVVLDPGHGGGDRGSRGRRHVEEKRVVLDVARRARVRLVNAGLKVHMTRDADKQVDLSDRCRKAAGWGADLFVSIHLNSAANGEAGGPETYVLTPPGFASTSDRDNGNNDPTRYPGNRYDGANFLLGYHLHKNLVDRLQTGDRGIRRARFVVLREAPCPAVLLECGFVSNKAEEERMLQDDYREKMAAAIADGVLAYVDAIRRAQAE